MINARCPHCQRPVDLLAAVDHEDGVVFLERLARLPAPALKPVLRYLALFAPPGRAPSWGRLLRLLEGLVEPLTRGELRRDGKLYAAPLDTWLRAMTRLVDEPPKGLALPLRSHGYLAEMIAGQAQRVSAATEQARIDSQRRRPSPPPGDAAAASPARPASDVALATLDGLRRGLRAGPD